MKKHLYDSIAERWLKKNGAVWLYSDPHFNDPDSKLMRPDYIGDEEQLRRINSKVGKNDTIIILGDLGDLSYVKRIRGYKVLVMGNHDAGASNYKRVTTVTGPFVHNESHTEPYTELWEKHFREHPEHKNLFDIEDNHLFDEVYEGPLMINDRIILSHEPISPLPPYMFNIHGHTHRPCNATVPEAFGVAEPHGMNLCAERTGYMPVSLKRVIESGFLSQTKNIHEYTVDKRLGRDLTDGGQPT